MVADQSDEKAGYTPLVNERELSREREPARQYSPPIPAGALDIVQFTTAIYIVDANEGKINCDIMRIGRMKDSLSFSYRTEGKSAIAGRQFEDVTGRLEMGPGQDSATIEVPILDDDGWNPTTEFKVNLFDPEGCELGLYLKVARVKVIDADVFPSNRFRELINKGDAGIRMINNFSLFQSVMYLMLQFDGIKSRTAAIIFMDQLKNLNAYLKLRLAIFMVDNVFNMDTEEGLINGDRLLTSYYVAALYITPMIVLYIADRVKIKMDIDGHLEEELSKSLFRKFMNYSMASQHDVPNADKVTAVTRDANELSKCFAVMLELICLAGKLSILTFLTLRQNPSAWWAVVAVPIVMIIWGGLRASVFMRTGTEASEGSASLVRFVHEMIGKLDLIGDYHQRPLINDLFTKKADEYRAIKVPNSIVEYENVFFARSLGPAVIALYTAVGAKYVLQGDLTLGVYLATISVFGDVCDAFAEAFTLAMGVVSKFPTLVGVTCMLNKEIELPAWKLINRMRRGETKAATDRELAKATATDDDKEGYFVPVSDRLHITMSNMTFVHEGHKPLNGFVDANLTCPQGMICSIVGLPGQGVATLMELLGHRYFPSKGKVFIPSHLRILNVASDPVLMNFSAWQNLTFDNPQGTDPYRVENILRGMKMHGTLALCDEDLKVAKQAWSNSDPQLNDEGRNDEVRNGSNPLDRLSATQKAEIHLARALIANPEVLILHHPFMYFRKAAHVIGHHLEAIAEHRDNRGFKMPAETSHSRRPRTVFYNPDSQLEEDLADIAWVMPNHSGEKIEVRWMEPGTRISLNEKPEETFEENWV